MLDVKLFERHPRGMEPTLYGETMIRHARMALTSLSAAHDDIVALKHGLSGQVEVGVIMTPAMGLLPRAISRIKLQAPKLRIGVHMEASKVLVDMLQRGKLDFMIGRIVEEEGAAGLHYEELTVEPACAVARVGHPLLKADNLKLADLANQPWILPPQGSVLRHRWELMFRRAALEPPSNNVDTTALLLITALLQQTDSLHVMPVEVARYYASLNVLAILPIELPCHMDAFGIITREGHLMSPAARQLLHEVRLAARDLY
jgi:DNA-binding transcriptional LysR family regulator